jgi:outer membrane lipoprotein SlyB
LTHQQAVAIIGRLSFVGPAFETCSWELLAMLSRRNALPPLLAGFVLLVALPGCQNPSHTEEGAIGGGLIGGAAGALIGSATGHAGAGAAIGAGVGALSGAAIGHGMDESEARNRALIEQRLGYQVAAGAVTVPDVVTMTRAGVGEELIINHVHAHGLAAPLQTGDLICLQQQGVSPRVVAAMQATPVAVVPPPPPGVVYPAGPPPVVIEGGWGPGYYRRPYYYR